MKNILNENDVNNLLLAAKSITDSLEANGVEEWVGIWSMVAIIQTCFLRRPEGMEEYESLLKASLEDFREKWEKR